MAALPILLLAVAAGAQPAGGQPVRPTLTGPSRHDVSPPLRKIPPAVRPPRPPREAPEPGRLPPRPAASVTDPVTQTWSGPLAIPSTSTNFEGMGNGFKGPQGTFVLDSAPPDTVGDIGPNHYVQMVNTEIAVFDRTGKTLYGPVPSETLWSGFGGGCQTNNDGDGVVKYDKRADRWIITQFSVSTSPMEECLAVSTTGDPTGSYSRYAFTFSDFPDYPKLAVWPDAYYITYNMFNGNNFDGGEVCAYDRAAMLAGGLATQQCFGPVLSMGGSLPSDVDGPTDPPAGSPNYVMTFGTNSLLLWKVHVDWGSPGQSSLTGPTSISTASFAAACSGGGTCIPQPSTTTQLDSLADRLMHRLAYRNFGDHEAILVNHSVTPSGSGVGVSGVRWYEVRSPGSSPSIFQQGTFAPADGTSRWMGSIAMDGSGDVAVGYSASSGSVFPSIRYTGRLVGDPSGTLPQGEATIQAGAGSQTTYVNSKGKTVALTRWGDYSALSVDPVDDCTFWYTNEYLASSGAFNWHTRIGSFKFSSCSSCTPPATPVITAPSSTTAGTTGLIASAANHAGSTYSWSITDGTITGGNGTSQITFTAGTAGTLTLQVVETNSSGCPSAAGTASVAVDSTTPPPTTATRFYTLTPCRILDTRNAAGPYGGPALSAGTSRTFVLAGQCGIPTNAVAVSVNITVTQATSDGTLKLNPAGVTPSPATAISFSVGQTLANNAMAFLGANGDVSVEDDQLSGTTEFIADVNGYFK